MALPREPGPLWKKPGTTPGSKAYLAGYRMVTAIAR